MEPDEPLPTHVGIGATVENQEQADKRIPELLKIPVMLHFVSMEPLLGPVTLREIQHEREFELDALTGDHGVYRPLQGRSDRKLGWVIAGGESGPKARPSHPDWFRSLKEQCKAAGVPYFHKQNGEWVERTPDSPNNQPMVRLTWKRKDGQNLANVDDGGDLWMQRVGKKAAGHRLDGVEHRERPEVI